MVVIAGLPAVRFDFSVSYAAGLGQKIPRWFPNEAPKMILYKPEFYSIATGFRGIMKSVNTNLVSDQVSEQDK